ncbi:MAG: hypothetical protein RQ761_12920 [Bacteroidales bacterium]|nr:hypothetical protein [Bacteroidales bacterium]
MRRTGHQLTLVLLLLFIPFATLAQQIKTAKGSSEVRVESNMSKSEARELAEEQAKINAIESVYGTYLEQGTDLHISDGRVDFDIIGNTRVKGEWIRTIRGPEFSEDIRPDKGDYGKENITWIKCTITGKVRECVSRANLDLLSLNCPIVKCRSTSFFNGEDLFLYFKSPVNGYLSVFLDDGNEVYRLLPYAGMGTLSAVKIQGDKPYLLFSKDYSYEFDEGYVIDEMELFTSKPIEYNNLYVVFAERQYVKPILNELKEMDDGYLMPKSLPIDDFKEWLGDCRADMPDFQAKRIKISIEKR